MDLLTMLTGLLLVTSGISISFSISNGSIVIEDRNNTVTNPSPFFNQSGVLENGTVITNSTISILSNATIVNNSTSYDNSSTIGNSTNFTTNISTVPYTGGTSILVTSAIPISNITAIKPILNTDAFISHVSLHLSYNNEFLCGGVILNVNLIVTVAHCMYYNWGGILPPIIVTVNAGRESLDDLAIGQFEVEDIRFHNSYKESTSEYDLALIKIRTIINFAENIGRMSFAKTQTKQKQCRVVGWNETSRKLKAVPVEVISCNEVHISKEVICAQGTTSKDILCNHSVGSSLICEDSLIGILSSGPKCKDLNQVAVFQNIVKSTKWFMDNGIHDSSSGISCHSLIRFAMVSVVFILFW